MYALVLGLSATFVSATTVVVIRTPQEVVIAADSADVIEGDGMVPTRGSVCKIYQVDETLFFAVSGLVNDANSGYSLPAIVVSQAHGGVRSPRS